MKMLTSGFAQGNQNPVGTKDLPERGECRWAFVEKQTDHDDQGGLHMVDPPPKPAQGSGEQNSRLKPVRCLFKGGTFGDTNRIFHLIEGARQPGGEKIREQAHRGPLVRAIPAWYLG